MRVWKPVLSTGNFCLYHIGACVSYRPGIDRQRTGLDLHELQESDGDDMRKLVIGNRTITDEDCFVIAEIGSNHMGDPGLCEKMIIAAARCGVDAVKMQKRDNAAMFTKTALNAPYMNELSYGPTYGAHRERLDWFGMKEFKRFKAVAEKHGVLFFATPFEEKSADFLHGLGVPLWKIASCDVTNLPLVRKVAEYGDPVIISTGGADNWQILRLVNEIRPINPNFALLHCISTYPNEDHQLNLRYIEFLREIYPDIIIGFSSHHPGIEPCIIARTLGASIFEVHFTLNRGAKGTDHGFSFEPRGLETLVEDLKRVKIMLGNHEKQVFEAEKTGFIRKMGKGIYPARYLPAGRIIEVGDLVMKSPAGPLSADYIDDVLGMYPIHDLSTGVGISMEDLDCEGLSTGAEGVIE
jgi:sialic acid synthase